MDEVQFTEVASILATSNLVALAVSINYLALETKGKVLDFIDRGTCSEVASCEFNDEVISLKFFAEDSAALLRTSRTEDGELKLNICRIMSAVIQRSPIRVDNLLLLDDRQAIATCISIHPRVPGTYAIVSPRNGLYISEARPGRSPTITRLHSGARITSAAWQGALLAWTSEDALYVIDISTNQKIAALDLIRPSDVYWVAPLVLSTVSSAESNESTPFSLVSVLTLTQEHFLLPDAVPITKAHDPAQLFKFPGCVVFCAGFEPGQPDLAVLCRLGNGEYQMHVVCLDSCVLAGSNIIRLPQWDEISIFCSSGSLPAYTLTPAGLVSIHPRTLSQHAEFFASQSNFPAAIACARRAGRDSLKRIGFMSLRPLVESGRIPEALGISKDLEMDATQWSIAYKLFERNAHSAAIAMILPEDLDLEIYLNAIKSVARQSPEALEGLLRKWDGLYDAEHIKNHLRVIIDDQAPDHKTNHLKAAVRYLFEKSGDFEEALSVSLISNDFHQILAILEERLSRCEAVCKWAIVNAAAVFNLGTKQAASCYANHTAELPIDAVVDRIADHSEYTNNYFRAVFDIDPLLSDCHNLELLRHSENPSAMLKIWEAAKGSLSDPILEKILQISTDVEVRALTLWKLNRPFDSLQLLLDSQLTPALTSRAVAFAASVGDGVLWDCLVDRVIDSRNLEIFDALIASVITAENEGRSIPEKGSLLSICARGNRMKLSPGVTAQLPIDRLETATRIMGLLAEISDSSEIQKKAMMGSHGGALIELGTEELECQCCRRIIREGEATEQVEDLEEFSLKELLPNSATNSPWITVFRNGKVSHARCLIDSTLRSSA